MNLFVVGGSGQVGSLVLPFIARRHALAVYDLRPPVDPAWAYVPGNVGDLDALAEAIKGADALLYMAMGNKYSYVTTEGITTNLDVNIKGVHLALEAAGRAGVPHAVYTSSMSVYGGELYERYFPDETVPPDSDELYGFSKRLGELACERAARVWPMSVNALRLCFPKSAADWQAEAAARQPTIATDAEDVANAILAALDYRHGFEAFMISGDFEERIMNMAKARRLLHWAPRARPQTHAA
ncbi:MAG: NAD(P)-dependent oxidoreductase [Anaerolineales bacterium]|nr:NAD(P)-dependent oxidoreductase [Anaerolineales bacterium]